MIAAYINSHLAEFWITTGFALLAVEALLLGFTTVVLLFAGLGALITGLLMLAGALPETWLAGIAGFGISTGLSSALLWKPLQSLQGKEAIKKDNSSDLVGLEFTLEQAISVTVPGHKRYSGIEWRVEIDHETGIQEIAAGTRVVVTSVEVALFRVKPL